MLQNSNFKKKLGYEDIYFGSENNLTRAHAIQFLYNMHKQQLKDVKASEKTGNVTTLANQAQQKVNIAMMKQPEAFVKTGTSSKLYAAGVQYIVYKNGMVETIYASKPHGKLDSLLLVDAKGKTLLKSVGTLTDDQYNISNIVFLSNGNIQVDKYKTRYTFNKNGKIVSKKSITYKFDSPSMSHFAKKKSNGSDSVLEIYNAKTNKIEFSSKFEGSRFFDLALIGDNHYVVTCDKNSDNYCYAVFDKKGNKIYEVNRPDEEGGMVSHYREPVYISTSGQLYVKEKQFLEGKNGMDSYDLFYGFDSKGNVVSKSKLSTKEILTFDKEDNQPYIAAAYGHSIDSKSMMTESINIYKFK